MQRSEFNQVFSGPSPGGDASSDWYPCEGPTGQVVRRFKSLAIDRSVLSRLLARWKQMPEHSGVPRLFSHHLDQAPYASVEQRIEGQPLSPASGRKEAAAWDLIRELAEVLGHAHKHGVFHGHLHPGTIVLTNTQNDPRPWVLRFGSGLIGELHHIDLGENAAFCAPEQLLTGGRGWDEGRAQRWDVYSFGVLAYWLINGHLPRASDWIQQHQLALLQAGGRPVAFDHAGYVEALHAQPGISWGSSFLTSREVKLYRGIIDGCLALSPEQRPVDLREVRNQFRALGHQFALEDAEDRVHKERLKQQAKLFGARSVAVCLGLSCIGATYTLVGYFRKSSFFQNRVSELDTVVVTQQAKIHRLDERWSDTITDLKKSREAADTFFHRMASGDNAGGSGVAGIAREDLEKSRQYYQQTLDAVGQAEESRLERARALHSLAHIERKLGLREKAVAHFRDAIAAFDESIGAGDGEPGAGTDALVDLRTRLADCHETLSTLLANPYGDEALRSLEHAVVQFDEVIQLKPRDESIVTRQAGTAFRLGQAYTAHGRHDKAIAAFVKSATSAGSLRDVAQEEGRDLPHLTELLGKLQFSTAKSLRLAGRQEEAIEAHVAAMETLETLRGVNGFTSLQSLQLSEGYLELGELFAAREATPDDLDQLFNESLRLLSPLNTGAPEDVEVAILLCRSLVHLGVLEREQAHWSAGHRLVVRGIDALAKALEVHPDHVSGTLALAEARLEHLGFFKGDAKSSREWAEKGIATAEQAGHLLARAGVAEPLRTRHRERLERIFKQYGLACAGLGDEELIDRCEEPVVLEVSQLETAGPPDRRAAASGNESVAR